jgi:hypothetical protein
MAESQGLTQGLDAAEIVVAQFLSVNQESRFKRFAAQKVSTDFHGELTH